MEKKTAKRNKELHFVMNDEELGRMHQKMEEMGILGQSAYLRKMALDGYCISLDTGDIRDMVTLLRRCSNNLNQYAKKANETGSIYEEDIKDLQARLDEIWDQGKEIIGRLAFIK